MKTFYVPKRQHDKKYGGDQKLDPNTNSSYVHFHILRNNIVRIEVQVWNAHEVVKGQSKYTKKHGGQYKREECHVSAHKGIGFQEGETDDD